MQLQEYLTMVHELDLGHHTLCIYTDGSIDLFVHSDHTLSVVAPALRLNGDETYHLFISLQEQFQQKEAAHEEGM